LDNKITLISYMRWGW